MGKLPFLQLYPGDWLGDTVSGCCLEAQGLWLRMMFLMHTSERYGYLSQNGSPIPHGSVARRCGCTPEQYESLLAELVNAGVPSLSDEGIVYSRRMVRDEQKRQQVRNRVVKHRSNASSNAPCNANVTPHKLEVRSYKSEEELKTKPAQAPLLPDPPPIVPAGLWLSFIEMRKKNRKPMTDHAGELIRRELQKLKDQGHDPLKVLEQSIRNGWADVFPLREERNGTAAKPSREEERREKTQRAIENVVGHRSGLVERLRAGVSGNVQRGVDPSLRDVVGGGGFAAGDIAPRLPSGNEPIDISTKSGGHPLSGEARVTDDRTTEVGCAGGLP